jgi:hypothetical protein
LLLFQHFLIMSRLEGMGHGKGRILVRLGREGVIIVFAIVTAPVNGR